MTREPIVAALFAKLASVPGLLTTSRVFRHFAEVPAADQPALYLAPYAQFAVRTRGLPTKWTVDFRAFIYISRETSTVPDTVLNQVLDAIELALAPATAAEVQTLGGLCDHAWIEGDIQTDIDTLGSQLLCVVPIRLLVTT